MICRCIDCGQPLPGLPPPARCATCQRRIDHPDERARELLDGLPGADLDRLRFLRSVGERLEHDVAEPPTIEVELPPPEPA